VDRAGGVVSTFGLCPYCGAVKPSDNGTGSDVACCGERGHAKVIHTEHVYPPIPERSWDWSAVFDGYDGAPDSRDMIGRGRTEQAAIADLVEQANEACDEEPIRVRGVLYRNEDAAHDDDVQRQIDEVAP
jgi:hypothetical protein